LRTKEQFDVGYISKINMTAEETKLWDTICKKINPNFILPKLDARMELQIGPRTLPKVQEKLEKYYSVSLLFRGNRNDNDDEVMHRETWTSKQNMQKQ